MKIGIPAETKVREGRIALIPQHCAELVKAGHAVLVQSRAGELSGYSDADYTAAGAQLLPDAESLYREAGLIVKVKEPYGKEIDYLRPEHVLFCFLHLAANAELAHRLEQIGLTTVAFETVSVDGRLPLLAPMSEIAGKVAVQVGASLLHATHGGRGILLGGASNTQPGQVVVLGAGMAGGAATQVAAALGAQVTVFDRNQNALQRFEDLGERVKISLMDPAALAAAVTEADLLVGSVLVPGDRAPHLVSTEQVKTMKKRSVIIDISVDQGGCIETTHPTTYDDPTYLYEDVIHFGVTNMPGAVPRTASQALSAVISPYVVRLANDDWMSDQTLREALNTHQGKIVHEAVKKAISSV